MGIEIYDSMMKPIKNTAPNSTGNTMDVAKKYFLRLAPDISVFDRIEFIYGNDAGVFTNQLYNNLLFSYHAIGDANNIKLYFTRGFYKSNAPLSNTLNSCDGLRHFSIDYSDDQYLYIIYVDSDLPLDITPARGLSNENIKLIGVAF